MKSKLDVLEHLSSTPIVQVACQKAGVSRATYYRWRNEDSKFQEKSDLALKEGVSLINDMAESQLLSLIREKHPTSIYYWLNHRHPEYSDKRLLLPAQEQTQLIGDLISLNRQETILFILKKLIQGKISYQSIRSFIPALLKITVGSESNESDEAVDKLNELIRSVRKEIKEGGENTS